MAKEIQFPTQDWLDNWVDNWLDNHPTEKVDDFSKLTEKAEQAWWDKQIDKGNPTPYDLPEDKLKEIRKETRPRARKETTAPNKPRERKPNEDKRAIIQLLAETFSDYEGCKVSNVERQVDFIMNGVSYSITLTAHRPPKNKE